MAKTATKTDKKAKASKVTEPAKKLPQKKIKHHHVPRGKHGGMQLMLVEDVQHLGKAGEVVEVRLGYGRNYLLPRGLATFVNPHNMKLLELHKIKVQKIREAKLADLRAMAEQLQRVSVTIQAQANEEGHLYGSVSAAEIVTALKQQNLVIEHDAVKLEGVIKELGLYEVKLQLAPEIESNIKVLVISQTDKK
ncbi:MAG TPA: 50S ribosomal protein L9 [Gemmatales bacterium]|nr:50S ribosomal protein L9 [Gemmatales bacterium]HMP18255.1 50S ribosomal protein L9 [Gemmatales bacterium]